MGRLIDIDEVIKVAENTFPQEDVRKIMWVLCHTPTAYDVEKVVAELENRTERYKYNYHTCDNIPHQQYELGQYYGILKAIDIVKAGGKNER